MKTGYYTYKMDVLDALKRAGYSTYRLRKDGLLSEKAITKLRNGVDLLSWGELETVCNLLDVPFFDVVTDQRAQQRDEQLTEQVLQVTGGD